MARWAVTVTYKASTADVADFIRDSIAADLDSVYDVTVSDVIGVPAEDEPTTHVDNVDTY